MKKRFGKLLLKRGERIFKRFGFAKKTLSKPTQVVSGEIIRTSTKAGSEVAGGGLVKYTGNGLQKISKGETVAYKRMFKGRNAGIMRRNSLAGPISEAVIVEKSASKYFGKALPLLKKGGGLLVGAAAWAAADHLISYAFDKFAGAEEDETKVAAVQQAREHIAEITKTGALEDALIGAGFEGSGSSYADNSAYYDGPELSDQADLVKRLMLDMGLSATGDVTSQLDVAKIKAFSNYSRADLILRLVTIVKGLCSNSQSPEVFTLLARQGMSSSLDSVGWTESFESLVNKDDLESTSTEAIASEYNVLYEGLFEEHRKSVADTYFNEVTKLFNFKSDRTNDFAEGEASASGVEAKLRFALSSMVTDDSFADVDGWFDKLKVDEDNAKDDEYLAALELLRYSTLGSLFISSFVAAINNNSYLRRNILSR